MVTLKGVLEIYLHENHVNKDKMKRSRTVLVLTLTSSVISKRSDIQILKCFDFCKRKLKGFSGALQILKIEAKNGWGKSAIKAEAERLSLL